MTADEAAEDYALRNDTHVIPGVRTILVCEDCGVEVVFDFHSGQLIKIHKV